MRARKYTKIIELWQTTEIADGYGGYTVGADELITRSWCNISTPLNNRTTQRLTDLGITDVTNTIVISLRYRQDVIYTAINQYIVYRGSKYIIQNLPNNINFNDVDIEILATRIPERYAPDQPSLVNTFDNTFDNTFL